MKSNVPFHPSSLIPHPLIYGTRNFTSLSGLWRGCARDIPLLPAVRETFEGERAERQREVGGSNGGDGAREAGHRI